MFPVAVVIVETTDAERKSWQYEIKPDISASTANEMWSSTGTLVSVQYKEAACTELKDTHTIVYRGKQHSSVERIITELEGTFTTQS